MSDQTAMYPGQMEPAAADLELATRRLMAALDSLESAVERRREADRDEDELATRIQALGADRSRLADELDGSLMKSRKLERANREIAERLDVAIGGIRSVLSGAATAQAQAVHGDARHEDALNEDAPLLAALREDDDAEDDEDDETEAGETEAEETGDEETGDEETDDEETDDEDAEDEVEDEDEDAEK
jgi:hypothetical protein